MKTVSYILTIAIFSTSFFMYGSQKSQAFIDFATIKLVIKEYIEDAIARGAARSLLTQLSDRVIQKIQNGGREGGPAFVQDWRSFILGGQYRGEDIFRGILYEATFEAAGGRGVICPQFKDDLGKIFNAAKVNLRGVNKRVDSLQSYAVQAKCTLPSNIANFYEDFSQGGGWEAFLRTLEPQNTLSGAIALSEQELDKQRKVEEKADTQEAVSGSGYTGLRTGCEGAGPNRKCAVLGKIVTPPDLLGRSAAKTIDAEFDWLTSSDEITETISLAANVILQRITGEILGGAGLAGSGSVAKKTDPEKTPAPPFSPGSVNQFCFVACFNKEADTCNDADDKNICFNSIENQCQQQCSTITNE